MKRFYDQASYAPAGDHFEVRLDGRSVKTQGKNILKAPTERLARAVTAEWSSQDAEIRPESMPLTQMLSTAIDRTGMEREAMERQLLAYLDTDLVCYRTDTPEDLARLQSGAWDPWLEWFENRFGQRLETTTALKALRQDEKAHRTLKSYIAKLDQHRFTILQILTALSGSVVLALGFVEGEGESEDVFKAAQVEELYKAEIYNEDLHGAAPQQEIVQAALKRDLEAARTYLGALA